MRSSERYVIIGSVPIFGEANGGCAEGIYLRFAPLPLTLDSAKQGVIP